MAPSCKYKCLHPICEQNRADGKKIAEYHRMDGLKDHVLKEHYGVIWQCDGCDLFFPTPQSRSKHLKKNLDKNTHANQSGHLAGKTKSDSFRCQECHRWFQTQRELRNHSETKCVFVMYEKMRKHYKNQKDEPDTSK